MEIISNIALITINETMFVQVGSFLIFMYILNRMMIQPLKDTLNERESYVVDMKREIQGAEEEVESITRQLRRQERQVRTEASEIASGLETVGSQEADQIIADALKDISEINKKTEMDIDAVLSEARKSLKAESEVLAQSVIEKILNRRL